MRIRNSFLILLLLTSAFAYAGGSTAGNGGGAWVCRDSGGTIIWTQLVDLFEAVSQFGLSLRSNSGSYETIVDATKQRLVALKQYGSGAGLSDVLPGIESQVDGLNYLKPSESVTYTDEVLPVVDDALYYLVPWSSSCSGAVDYEQIVNFHDDGTIDVQSELFQSLSENAKAALVTHEAVYASRRTLLDHNSVISRRVVGYLFSDLPDNQIFPELEEMGAPMAYLSSPGIYSSEAYAVSVSFVNELGAPSPLSNVTVMLNYIQSDCSSPDSGGHPTGRYASTNAQGVANVPVPR